MNSRNNIRSRTWKVEVTSGAKKEVYVKGDDIPEGKSVGDPKPKTLGTIWSTPTKDAERRMLKVQFLKARNPRAFYVDIPKHFFDAEGTFTATPPYEKGELIDIQWTGWGKYSGWIDTNVQMRGAGIGTVIEQGGVACAKWS